MQFTELPLCDTLLEGLQAMNFKETTPIQEQAIPVILQKQDVIACAQTGTGKTAAFLLPLLNNLQTEQRAENKVSAIIMAPTRELAQQIDQQMEGFSYFTPFSSVAVYGGNDGEAWDVQKKGLMNGADVVIATPGRLLSHINLYKIDFSGVKYFILDEADRMLDMGFFDDIMKIEKLLPKDRQTIMFSATMPPKIQQLAKTILRNPAEISIAVARPPETILQSAYICYEAQKLEIVKHLFKEKKPNKVILFSGSKQKVKDIAKILRKMGLSAGEMHSDLDQSQRNHVMHEFKNERVDILVATDIVARGIDIDDITLVINFDVPYDAEDYVHRIGRTARAGDSGMAITFVSPAEQYRFSQIEKFLQKDIYRIPVPSEFGEAPEYSPSKDTRQRGASNRSFKGGRNKDAKPSGRYETSRKSGRSGAPRKQEASGTVPEQENLQKQEALETPRGQEKSREQKTSETPRQQRPPRKQRTQGTAHEQRAPREQETSGTPPEQEKPREQKIPGTSRLQRPLRKQEGRGTPREQEKPQPSRKQGTGSIDVSVTDSTKKRSSTTQPAEPAPAQNDGTNKPKKKSWWPFGKKSE